MPWSEDRRSPIRDYMRRYGFIVDPCPDAQQPGQLPVGFATALRRAAQRGGARHHLRGLPHRPDQRDAPNGRTTALRIDGGSAMHAFTDIEHRPLRADARRRVREHAGQPDQVQPVRATRCSDRVELAGAGRRCGPTLTSRQFRELVRRAATKLSRHWCRPRKATAAPTRWRGSRTPSSATTSSRRTTRIGNAPVNYPPVWNIWKFDWVQYNASVSQPMARNIGEAMGTGATYTLARSLRPAAARRRALSLDPCRSRTCTRSR